jgi:hypothetical protein
MGSAWLWLPPAAAALLGGVAALNQRKKAEGRTVDDGKENAHPEHHTFAKWEVAIAEGSTKVWTIAARI